MKIEPGMRRRLPASIEGDGPKGGMVLIEFDSKDQAQAWYDSPAYRRIMRFRHQSATSRVYIVEGAVTLHGSGRIPCAQRHPGRSRGSQASVFEAPVGRMPAERGNAFWLERTPDMS